MMMRHLADIKADLLVAVLPGVTPEEVHRARRTLGFTWSRTRWGSLAQLVRVCYQLGYVLSRRPRAKVEWFGHARGIVVLKLGNRFAEWLVVGHGRGVRVGEFALLGMPPVREGDGWVWLTPGEWESWARMPAPESRSGFEPRWGSLLTLDGETV